MSYNALNIAIRVQFAVVQKNIFDIFFFLHLRSKQNFIFKISWFVHNFEVSIIYDLENNYATTL